MQWLTNYLYKSLCQLSADFESFVYILALESHLKVSISLKIRKAKQHQLGVAFETISELYAYMQPQFRSAMRFYTLHNYLFLSTRQWKLHKPSHKRLQT